MEEDKKELLKLLMEMRETASENLYKWVFAVITLCSVVSGYIVTNVLESAQSHQKILASIGLITFTGIILFSFGHLLKTFRNNYLLAWGEHKSLRGLNISGEEKEARKREKDKPYQFLNGIFLTFGIGIFFTILSILPAHFCTLSTKGSIMQPHNTSKNLSEFSRGIDDKNKVLNSGASPQGSPIRPVLDLL